MAQNFAYVGCRTTKERDARGKGLLPMKQMQSPVSGITQVILLQAMNPAIKSLTKNINVSVAFMEMVFPSADPD